MATSELPIGEPIFSSPISAPNTPIPPVDPFFILREDGSKFMREDESGFILRQG